MNKKVEKQFFGVDYLTVTATKKDTADAIMERCRVYGQALRADGILSKPWKFKGYSGESFGFFNWGLGPMGALVMMSGPTADKYLEHFLTDYDNVTRVDIQVTIQLEEPYTKLIDTHLWELKNLDKTRQASRSWRTVRGSDGGATLYIGSRKSGKMLRIYDKGVQSGEAEPGLIWRYELELKKPYAGNAAIALVQADDRGVYITRAVDTHCRNNGLCPIFVRDFGNREIAAEAKVSTADSKLKWLATSVRPTVALLAELGYTQDVLRALGLKQSSFKVLDDIPDNSIKE